MNIQQLEYIVAVDKYRHFSKAAEACFVTQPTLSMMVQKLEEELEVKIFDRSQVPVVPTKIGEKILAQARVVLGDANGIKDIVENEKGIVKGVFRMGIIPTIAPYLVPRLMHVHSFLRQNIKIEVSELTTDLIILGLKEDKLDGAILATPLKEPQITEHPIYYERFYAYVSPEERSLYAKTSLEPSDLNTAKMWLLDEVHCFRTQILNLCKYKQSQSDNHSIFQYEAGSIDTLINIVDSNGGITVIPSMATEHLSEEQKKKVRPFKMSTPVREISLITDKYNLREKMIETIIQEVKKAVPQFMQDESLKKYVVPL